MPRSCCKSRPAPAPATGGWRKSFTTMSSAPTASSAMCSIWPGATGSNRSDWCWRPGWRLSVQEFLRGLDGPTPEWRQTVEPAELAVIFDPHQLRQVLWNLCANACQHGVRAGETPQIELRAGLDDSRARPFLDVRDAGSWHCGRTISPNCSNPFSRPGPRAPAWACIWPGNCAKPTAPIYNTCPFPRVVAASASPSLAANPYRRWINGCLQRLDRG